ncbi:HEPN domain-containing protein [Candidatus Methanomarinus sp.]|nr:HEPN domain-containing protein [ANME-2 cluster archaeon]
MSENLKESLRWFKQAEKDLKAAKNSLLSADYEWACFQAQQAAEKALKSILYAQRFRKILTHSVFELIKEVSRFEGGFKELKHGAKVLDSVYITTRYPNGIAGDLVPFEYYEKEDVEECIMYAGSISERVKEFIGK